METLYFLGIDISKKTIDAALTSDGINTYDEQQANNTLGIQQLFKELKKKFCLASKQIIVCIEHTGIYCQPLLDYVVKNKINICIEPALQIKQSQGITRGKNDKIDARRIAIYAYKNRNELKFWKPQRKVVQELKALLVTRDRLVKIKHQLETPLKESREFIDESIRKIIIKNCKKTLKCLSEDIKRTERAIDILVKEDECLSQQMKWATSVPGIGRITATNLIVATGEFERISEVKKFACYSGIAPFEHSSGTSIRGKTRVSKMANMSIKKLLHLAAMTAIQFCEEIKIFYHRKITEGKNKMSVLNAVRNKLISRVFACIKNKRMYENNYHHSLSEP
jgi:transposase